MIQNASNELSESPKLYRFVSFFDLYEILVKHRLRMSKLSTFLDMNEGGGHILQFQDDELFRYAFIDKARIAEAHVKVLENHYVTCWSREPDMMAMWSLYSPDHMSIRISTTVSKLTSVLEAHHNKISWVNSIDEPGSRKVIGWKYSVEPVEYVDFFELRDEIRKKYQEFDKKVNLCASKDENYFKSPDGFNADYEKFCEEKVVKRSGLFLKDRAYNHENEVRGILHCGVRNDMTREEYAKLNNPLKYYFFDPAKKAELDDYVFATVDANFIESICFDPRMSAYKRKTFENVLGGLLPELVESKAFGYALNQESFASDFDGYPK